MKAYYKVATGELDTTMPPGNGWKPVTPQHRARIYDAPRLSRTWTFRPNIGPFPTTITLDAIPIEAFQGIMDAMHKAAQAFSNISISFWNHLGGIDWTILDIPPYRTTKAARRAAAFAERHARHVERRRARIVGMLGRVQ